MKCVKCKTRIGFFNFFSFGGTECAKCNLWFCGDCIKKCYDCMEDFCTNHYVTHQEEKHFEDKEVNTYEESTRLESIQGEIEKLKKRVDRLE